MKKTKGIKFCGQTNKKATDKKVLSSRQNVSRETFYRLRATLKI